jgi:Type II CAAX prenyl endopeptidase Rce1-like/NAD(P)H-binding
MLRELAQKRILLTGASGFVGRYLFYTLQAAGCEVRCASRHPERARRHYPNRNWVRLDLEDPATVQPALEGCHGAYYLIHGMSDGEDYEEREARSTETFVTAAQQAGLQRIVYLGGVQPAGLSSRHLRSRLRTGEILQQGAVSTVELRAAMVIGNGGSSWEMVRDLAVRLPVMILPKWLQNCSQPIAITDVMAEECIWRGLLIDALYPVSNLVTVILCSAVIYSLPHLAGRSLILFGVALVCGTLWGLLRVATGSVLVPVLSHLAWNLNIFIFFPLE